MDDNIKVEMALSSLLTKIEASAVSIPVDDAMVMIHDLGVS